MVSSPGMSKRLAETNKRSSGCSDLHQVRQYSLKGLRQKKDEKENIKTALDTLEKKFKQPLSSYKFRPRAYVRFEGRPFVIQLPILGTDMIPSYPQG